MTIPMPTSGSLGRVRTWIVATAALVTLALTALAPSAAQAASKPSCVNLRHSRTDGVRDEHVLTHGELRRSSRGSGQSVPARIARHHEDLHVEARAQLPGHHVRLRLNGGSSGRVPRAPAPRCSVMDDERQVVSTTIGVSGGCSSTSWASATPLVS